jgi:hypothetical protein
LATPAQQHRRSKASALPTFMKEQGLRILYVQPACDRKGHYGLSTIKLCQALAKLGHSVTPVPIEPTLVDI